MIACVNGYDVRMDQSDEQRFLAKVDKTESCWLWTANITGGYGKFYYLNGPKLAHRVSYEHYVGPIPEGLQLDHLCRVRHCVNPDHLEPVTHAENMRRGNSGWQQRERTHCPQGHEYTPENTYHGTNGRACRTCQALHQAAYRQRRAANGIR